MGVILRGGTIVTMNPEREVLVGDVRLEGERIHSVGERLTAKPDDQILDCSQHFVLPGLIQAHTHLCQALFRGLADDLSLLSWLEKRIWPMEAAHDPTSLEASARIGLLEMQLLGTTAIIDMGTVRHTDVLFATAAESGIRYVGGKCLMDLKESSGPLWEPTDSALAETKELIQRWHRTSPLLDYAISPRFAISCTDGLLRQCAELHLETATYLHTHASESKEELAAVRARTGKSNVHYLDAVGILGPKTILVHGVHLLAGEVRKLVSKSVHLVHCPSANLKLASGIAPIASYQQQGVILGIGADGAPCNNTMDPFLEMRLTALLQKPRFGPEALPAQLALELATLGGARVLGRAHELGSLEPGKLADVIVVESRHPSVATVNNPYSALVYSCSGRDVRHVFTHGQQIVCDRKHWRWDHGEVMDTAIRERDALLRRACI